MLRKDKSNPIIFEKDSLAFRTVDEKWTREELLNQEGIFYLKDITKHLGLNPIYLKSRAKSLNNRGISAWEVMGIKSIWRCWIVRMKVFAPYLRAHLKPVNKIKSEWDGNILLAQKGIFYLADVCKHIPFTAAQFRYQAQNDTDSREKIGVWKDEYHNAYLVEMESFSAWVKNLWREGFRTSAPNFKNNDSKGSSLKKSG